MTDRTGIALQVRRLFDAKAASWPSKYAPGGRLADRLSRLADAVAHQVPAGGNVLDLGCGTGDLARYLSGAGFQVTGCDVSASMLTKAATIDPVCTVEWVQLNLDWQVLPYSDDSFDAIVASSVLEYVVSPAEVLAECTRVLRPGAVVLATVPDLAHPVRWLEGVVHLFTILPGVRTAARVSPRLDNYMAYLRISRQRHPGTWWSLAAARAGLLTLPTPHDPSGHTPLRLFTFQRPIDTGRTLDSGRET
jgi:ubiquinone/menaquinone biosynthesis C-methylase UbiE